MAHYATDKSKKAYTVKLSCYETENVIIENINANGWREALKAAVQLHPELPGPFYTTDHYLWLWNEDRTRKVTKAPKTPDRNITVTQGDLRGKSHGFIVIAKETTTGRRRSCFIRLHTCFPSQDMQAVEAATYLEANRLGWKSPLTIYEVRSTAKSIRDFFVSRHRVKAISEATIQDLIHSGFEDHFDRSVQLCKPAGTCDVVPADFATRKGTVN